MRTTIILLVAGLLLMSGILQLSAEESANIPIQEWQDFAEQRSRVYEYTYAIAMHGYAPSMSFDRIFRTPKDAYVDARLVCNAAIKTALIAIQNRNNPKAYAGTLRSAASKLKVDATELHKMISSNIKTNYLTDMLKERKEVVISVIPMLVELIMKYLDKRDEEGQQELQFIKEELTKLLLPAYEEIEADAKERRRHMPS
ncbi:MAG: hypothetical protein E6R14_05675 [Thermomicrobiales bacterium]|nr:hypothetical protein [Nitrospira sp. CR2.1]MBA5876463.1 hypothetical protein [Nitrospira sp. CR1.2]TXG83878.1 MAG: hypothetical protein E6R14_05675 [Thermomicrobiales bacterium]